jgi:methylmalonyl-CoA mutase C-terminal domain/subunit
MLAGKNIRVLIAKPGLDGHDKGAKIVARALKDAGMEVIYTGIRQQTDAIVNAAIEEDVNVIGLSILSGSHMPICRELLHRLKESGAGDKFVIIGGIIPKKDVPKLKEMGVTEVFRPSTPTQKIVEFIEGIVQKGASKT